MTEQLSDPSSLERSNGLNVMDMKKYPSSLAYERLQAHLSEGQILTALSVHHTNDPESGLFSEIDRALQEAVASGTEAVVITEGGVWQNFKSDDREDTIQQGELQYAASSARNLGIEVVSGEPGMKAEITEVLNELGDTQEAWHALTDYYVMRMGPQLFQGNESREAVDEVFRMQLERLERQHDSLRRSGNAPEETVDFSLDAFKQRFNDRHDEGATMDLAPVKIMFDETVGHMLRSPEERDIVHEGESDIVAVSRIINTLRDESLAECIQRYAGEGKSVFTIYGKAHIDAIQEELQLEHHVDEVSSNAREVPLVHPYHQIFCRD